MPVTPVDIRELAEHLRDETWLDIRCVVDGENFDTLERVKIVAILVRRDSELIEVVQETELGTTDFCVEAEAIRWARPTAYDATTAKPYAPEDPLPDQMQGTAWDKIIARIAESQARDPVRYMEQVMASIDERYTLLAVAWHVTEWSPADLCKRVGYHSETPMWSALSKIDRDNVWKQAIMTLCHTLVTVDGMRLAGTRSNAHPWFF